MDDLEESDFKIYQSPTDLIVVIRGKENETPVKSFIKEGKLVVVSSLSQMYTVSLPEGCNTSGRRTCSSWSNFFLVKIEGP